ncbi:MAG: tannase/feruloyl esterase family alpha/beta hydrolase [Woeseiaceae bacterium]|nr:tannase/feruloyl esterase family alpha/beta hydrolase [Woeseiaceae bacterium]
MRSVSRILLPLVGVMSLVFASGCTPPAQEASKSAQPVACEALAALPIVNTTIEMAEIVAPGVFEPPVPQVPFFQADYSILPAFCRVAGSIRPTTDSDIRFELWLPVQGWNGKFMQTGNGGAAGSIIYATLADPLARGYAVAHTDTGHQGGGGDFSWAAGHPEKLTDFQYRAVHELTVVGKAITAAHFGQAPEGSYFSGCSTGGRQGLKEAQRFPEDYDAIVAGAPANDWTPLMSLSVLIARDLGPQGLGFDKLGVLKEAAIAACDIEDGVADRVIAEPWRCDFDPGVLQCDSDPSAQCLTATEVEAARRLYAGVVDKSGHTRMPGTGPGSEPEWAFFASPDFSIGKSYIQNVVLNDPAWDQALFDVDTDMPRLDAADDGKLSAINPDISAFIGRGGKLLLYHGTTDGLIPYASTVKYYERVVDTLGEAAVADSVRLYVVPGMDHCAGGEGAYLVDWLTVLEE